MQLHAKSLQVQYRRRLLGVTTQQAHRRETEAPARCCQSMEMIGVCAAQADQSLCTRLYSLGQVFAELEPFVAADERVNKVKTQDRHLDPGILQPGQVQALQRSSGLPVKGVNDHPRSLQTSSIRAQRPDANPDR